MSKIDFEKDRRRRLAKDICADAPWRNDDASVIARLGPRADHSLSNEDRTGRKRRAAVYVPRLPGTMETLQSMKTSLRGYYRHYPPWRKLEELSDIQNRMTRIVEREGAGIKATREYKLLESTCRREAEALQRLTQARTGTTRKAKRKLSSKGDGNR